MILGKCDKTPSGYALLIFFRWPIGPITATLRFARTTFECPVTEVCLYIYKILLKLHFKKCSHIIPMIITTQKKETELVLVSLQNVVIKL